MSAVLNEYKIESLNIVNIKNFKENQGLQLFYQFRLIQYDSSRCIANGTANIYRAEEAEQDDKSFCVVMRIKGDYSHDGVAKEDLKQEISGELLSLMRPHIAAAMAAIGMDPVLVPLHLLKNDADGSVSNS